MYSLCTENLFVKGWGRHEQDLFFWSKQLSNSLGCLIQMQKHHVLTILGLVAMWIMNEALGTDCVYTVIQIPQLSCSTGCLWSCLTCSVSCKYFQKSIGYWSTFVQVKTTPVAYHFARYCSFCVPHFQAPQSLWAFLSESDVSTGAYHSSTGHGFVHHAWLLLATTMSSPTVSLSLSLYTIPIPIPKA